MNDEDEFDLIILSCQKRESDGDTDDDLNKTLDLDISFELEVPSMHCLFENVKLTQYTRTIVSLPEAESLFN